MGVVDRTDSKKWSEVKGTYGTSIRFVKLLRGASTNNHSKTAHTDDTAIVPKPYTI